MADEDISAETRMLATDALTRARAAPNAGDIRGLEREALSGERSDMTPAEIRALAGEAAAHAEQISQLMTRLAVLLDANPDGRHE